MTASPKIMLRPLRTLAVDATVGAVSDWMGDMTYVKETVINRAETRAMDAQKERSFPFVTVGPDRNVCVFHTLLIAVFVDITVCIERRKESSHMTSQSARRALAPAHNNSCS